MLAEGWGGRELNAAQKLQALLRCSLKSANEATSSRVCGGGSMFVLYLAFTKWSAPSLPSLQDAHPQLFIYFYFLHCDIGKKKNVLSWLCSLPFNSPWPLKPRRRKSVPLVFVDWGIWLYIFFSRLHSSVGGWQEEMPICELLAKICFPVLRGGAN